MADVKTVFICSTYGDLSAERKGIIEAVRQLELRHDSMEYFGARANRPLDTCLAEVRKSDVLVVVVGHRYGTVANDLGISFSEAEYNEGYRLRKICLVYIKDEDVPVLPKDVERDPTKMRLLEEWKSRLRREHTVSSYKEREDLVVKVTVDLTRSLRDLEVADAAMKQVRIPTADDRLLGRVVDLVHGAQLAGVEAAALLSAIERAIRSLTKDTKRLPRIVYIVSSRRDQKIVEFLKGANATTGARFMEDLGDVRGLPDEQRGEAILNLMSRADVILILLSEAAAKSKFVQEEIALAIRLSQQDLGPSIRPIRIDASEIPPLLRHVSIEDRPMGDFAIGTTAENAGGPAASR